MVGRARIMAMAPRFWEDMRPRAVQGVDVLVEYHQVDAARLQGFHRYQPRVPRDHHGRSRETHPALPAAGFTAR